MDINFKLISNYADSQIFNQQKTLRSVFLIGSFFSGKYNN